MSDPIPSHEEADALRVRFHLQPGADLTDVRMVWRCATYDYPHTCAGPPPEEESVSQ